MLQQIYRTRDDSTVFALRVILGTVFFAHGAQKALGWFGGPGFNETIKFFGQMGIAEPLALLAIAAEFLGGLGLLVGLLARVAAVGIITNMLVAIFLVHSKFGFFMNWSGDQPGEGFEFHLIAIALAACVLVKGAGAYSVDRLLFTGESQSATPLGKSGAH